MIFKYLQRFVIIALYITLGLLGLYAPSADNGVAYAQNLGGGGGTINILPVKTFLGLTDTPNSYVGQTLKSVRVNAGETALEFYTPSASATTLADISGYSTDATKSLYTMTSSIPVEFRSSDGNPILYIDETNERIGVGTAIPAAGIESTRYAGTTDLIGLRLSGTWGTATAHPFQSTINHPLAAGEAYATYDDLSTTSGTANQNHVVSYQARPTHASSGTLDNLYGAYMFPTNNGGAITNRYGMVVADIGGAGTVTNNYGLYVSSLTRGATLNYAVYTDGTTKSYFGGNVGIGKTGAVAKLDVSATAGALVNIANFVTPSMTANQQNYIVFGSATSANNGFSMVYNHNATATSRYLAIQGNEAAFGSQLVLLAGGNVGIGTTAPSTLLQLGLAGTTLGTFSLAGNTSGLVTIQPAAAAGTWTLTLPVDDGTAGQFLQTDGAGVTSWATGGGGITIDTTTITGGATTQVLYNNAGVVSSEAAFVYNFTNDALTVGVARLHSTGTRNTMLGEGAGNFTLTSTDTSLFGYNAGVALTSGGYNTFGGALSGNQMTTGIGNTFYGYNSGHSTITESNYNSAFGYNAQSGGYAGYTENTAIGAYAGYAGGAQTSRNKETYVGMYAGDTISGQYASGNTIIGAYAGRATGNANHEIYGNTAVGAYALGVSAGGTGYNVAVGVSAMGAATSTVRYSVYLGMNSGLTTMHSSSIAIGYATNTTAANQLVIGEAGTTAYLDTAYFNGVVSTAPKNIVLNAAGGSGTNIAGATLTLAGGKGTGNALGGSIIFQTSVAGGSGTTLQTLATNMTLLPSGNLGIGITAPIGTLHTYGTTANYFDRVSATTAHLAIRSAGVGVTAKVLDDGLGRISFQGYDGTAWTTTAASGILVSAAENWDSTHHGSYMQFLTVNIGSVDSTEKMRLLDSGNLGIGVTVPTAVLHLKAGTATASTAPLKFNSGTLLSSPEAGAIEFLTDAYYGTVTTNAVRKMLVGSTTGRATAQTAANTSVATYTLGAEDQSFEVSANVLVTTSSAEAFTVTVDYTDEGNTARTITLNFQILAGTIGTGINFANGAVPYEGIPVHIRAKASTAITVKTAGTFTGATYNVEGIIKRTS